MPWRECYAMDERLRFVARLLDGEKMAVLCREFEISRKTGYKIFQRYKDCGLEGLTDRSRRPYRITPATSSAAMPDGTNCSAHTTPPLPPSMRKAPMIAALRHSTSRGLSRG